MGGKARRLDIKMSDPDKWPFATLHSTGSAALNVLMREKAILKGWTLSQNGLIDQNGRLIPAFSEEEIFAKLDMKYLTPEQRNM